MPAARSIITDKAQRSEITIKYLITLGMGQL